MFTCVASFGLIYRCSQYSFLPDLARVLSHKVWCSQVILMRGMLIDAVLNLNNRHTMLSRTLVAVLYVTVASSVTHMLYIYGIIQHMLIKSLVLPENWRSINKGCMCFTGAYAPAACLLIDKCILICIDYKQLNLPFNIHFVIYSMHVCAYYGH